MTSNNTAYAADYWQNLSTTWEPRNSCGSLEETVRCLRSHRPLDLESGNWRRAHPGAPFDEWQARARARVLESLHCEPGTLDLRAETMDRQEREGYVLERVRFNTTPWFRVDGWFLLPTGVTYPVPGLVVFHAWGGPMIFGKERVVPTGRDHAWLREHRRVNYDGRYLAEWFATHGYAVIVIDAFHFGARAPRGVADIPKTYDPFDLRIQDAVNVHRLTAGQIYAGLKQLNWAGTTWMGVNYWDDSRCVDYLLSRPEVDPERIGCTGLSGGGWRTDFLAALDPRLKAAVSVGWMTTGDHQQVYNVAGAIGTFCLLPGLWDRLDVPDLVVMGAPCAFMSVLGTADNLFPPEAKAEVARRIAAGYEWAGCPERFRYYAPEAPHCYNREIQEQALAWFDRWLGKEPS